MCEPGVCRYYDSLGASVEVEGFLVGLDGIALGFPAGEAASEEFYAQEIHGLSPVGDGAAGFIVRAGAVNDGFFVVGNEGRVLEQIPGRNSDGAYDDFGVGKEVEGLPNIEE